MSRRSRSERVRTRINRRLYASLFRAYRTVFPTPQWRGPLQASTIRRVLIVQHYGVGDMILTTPLIAYLRERLPGAEIDLLASPRNRAVVADDRRLANVYVHDHSLGRWLRLLPQLRARQYDIIFAGQAGRGLAEGLAASLVAHRFTYKLSIWRPKRYQGLFTALLRRRPGAHHTAEHLLRLGMFTFGDADDDAAAGRRYPLHMATDDAAERRVSAYLGERGLDRFVIVNLSAQFAIRDWRAEHSALVMRDILREHPDLAIIVTPAPGKANVAEDAAQRCGEARVVVAPMFSILELAALVRRAAVIISPSTALVHLGSACKRPVVALYAPAAPSEVALWLPIGVPYRALASPLGGRIHDIPPSSIAAAFAELFREVAPHRPPSAGHLVS